jgi:hypothetical protein
MGWGRACGLGLLAGACSPTLVGDAPESTGAIDEASTAMHEAGDHGESAGPHGSTESSTGREDTSTSDASMSGTSGSAPDVGFPGCPNEWQPPQCWASVCDVFYCGEARSMFDADGCPRQVCEQDADCDAEQYCNARMNAAPCFDVASPESCEFTQGQCVCGGNLDCGGDSRGFCLDAAEFPPEQACRALSIDCRYLDPWFVEGYESITEVIDQMAPEVLSDTLLCQASYVARFIDECGADPCEVLCQENAVSGCAGKSDCPELCGAADPGAAIAVALVLAADPRACSDCDACPADNALCAELWGCP